jgi:hypothetical protein
MSRPLESFEFLNRGWDIRLLEGMSLRKVFVFLLLDLFMLGGWTFVLIYDGFRFHRLDWLNAMLFGTCVLPVVRYSRLVYRRLDG